MVIEDSSQCTRKNWRESCLNLDMYRIKENRANRTLGNGNNRASNPLEKSQFEPNIVFIQSK